MRYTVETLWVPILFRDVEKKIKKIEKIKKIKFREFNITT